MPVRRPAVAGQFYPGDRARLERTLERLFMDERFGPGGLPIGGPSAQLTVAGVAPHAGYMYSGPVAAHLYKRVAESHPRIDTAVIIGTNHSGIGSTYVTTSRYSSWVTPLGEVKVDLDFIEELRKLYPALEDNEVPHEYEHSVEVQLPFLQFIYGDRFQLVPIVAKWPRVEEAKRLAEAIAEASRALGRLTIVIASSDFTHHGYIYDYVVFHEKPNEGVKLMDSEYIEKILTLDTEGFLEAVRRNQGTVCGVGAVAAVIEYSKLMDAKARLLKYYTSADVTGDEDIVVGYAAIEFFK